MKHPAWSVKTLELLYTKTRANGWFNITIYMMKKAMRKNNGLTLAVLFNVVLLIGFSYRNVQFLRQIQSVSNEIAGSEEATVKLRDLHRDVNSSTQQIYQTLRSNYIRLKEMTEYTRRYLIRIKGIPEKTGEDLIQSVSQLIVWWRQSTIIHEWRKY